MPPKPTPPMNLSIKRTAPTLTTNPKMIPSMKEKNPTNTCGYLD
ncbi:MAG: hypothetical protein ACXWRA_05830 [Pseudobdellovibrionaceae bacterium]